MIDSTPKFVQGIFDFHGEGYHAPAPVARFTVAADKRAQPIYLRAGNSADAMVSISLSRNGTLMRLFPVGAKGAIHVQLALVEDIEPASVLELAIAAPAAAAGVLVLDFGLIEI